MQQIRAFFRNIPIWLYGPVAIFLWYTILFFFKKLIFSKIHELAKFTKTKLDDIFVNSLDFPLTLIIFFSGALILEKFLPQSEASQLTAYALMSFKVVAIIAVILFFDKLFKGLIETYSKNIDILKASKGIVQGVVRVIVIALGLLIILDSFGISITPILASLGIGSLAVALALQPTLENFFSGIQDRAVFAKIYFKRQSINNRTAIQNSWWREIVRGCSS